MSYTFQTYARQIHAKIPPSDPNFVRWSVELGRVSSPFSGWYGSEPPELTPDTNYHLQVEAWCESHYPSFVTAGQEGRTPDVRNKALLHFAAERKERALKLARESGAVAQTQPGAKRVDPRSLMTDAEREAADKRERDEMIKFFVIIIFIVMTLMGSMALIVWFAAVRLESTSSYSPQVLAD